MVQTESDAVHPDFCWSYCQQAVPGITVGHPPGRECQLCPRCKGKVRTEVPMNEHLARCPKKQIGCHPNSSWRELAR